MHETVPYSGVGLTDLLGQAGYGDVHFLLLPGARVLTCTSTPACVRSRLSLPSGLHGRTEARLVKCGCGLRVG